MKINRCEEILAFVKELQDNEKQFVASLLEEETPTIQNGKTIKSNNNKQIALALRKKGYRYFEIAKKLNIPKGSVARLLKKGGYVPSWKRKQARYSDEQIKSAGELREQGLTNKQIAKITGINNSTIETGHIWRRLLKITNNSPTEQTIV